MIELEELEVGLEPLARASKDLREAAKLLTPSEVRCVVDLYYTSQKLRIRGGNQAEAMKAEPHALVGWVEAAFDRVETTIKTSMAIYTDTRRDGRWARSIRGIGPVLAAGLLAHIDISKAPTVGHIWRFAGLDPTVVWKKKQKRPWNADLKTLCWKVGQSFMKNRNRQGDVYGQFYESRKALEVERNEAGTFAEQAKATLAAKDITKKDTLAWYKKGMLPPGRIELRAERYAAKLFLSHLHHVMYECHFGTAPPKPFVIDSPKFPEHMHYVGPPNWPCD